VQHAPPSQFFNKIHQIRCFYSKDKKTKGQKDKKTKRRKVEMSGLAVGFFVMGFWLLAFGYWLLAIGFWLLAFGF